MLTILLAEDDEQFGKVVQIALARSGYTVLHARNGHEALRIYDPQTVDLVLTDLIMPGLEGVELIMRLNQLNPDIKIIAMSGGGRNSPDAYLEIVRRLGVKQTLVKPFTCEELRAAIQLVTSPKQSTSKTS